MSRSHAPARSRKPSRYRKPGRGNALLGWELLRVSRRTAALAVGRFAFGASLLGILWLLWSARYAEEVSVTTGNVTEIAKKLQKFAEAFSLTFFVVQLTLVFLLTPIFVAGAVFEERETRSGEVLLTTDLTRREVFYGKYLARVVQVMMVVAGGMPVLALTLLWGGVAMQFIALGYLATFLCILSSGAIAASVAGSSETMREAVLKSYAYILVFDGLIFPASPYFVIALGSDKWWNGACAGILFLPVQLIITFVSLAHGLRWLRLAMLRQRRRVTDELASQMASRKPPLPEENPLIWKERYVGGPPEGASAAIWALVIALIVLVAFLTIVAAGVLPPGWLASTVGPIVLLTAGTAIGLGASGGVARERQKNTLIDLFMLPGGRREILKAKLVGAAWAGRWFLLALGAVLALAPLAGTPMVAMPLLLLAAVSYLAFAAALGIWLSVRSRTALTAHAAWMGFSALSLIGTYLLADAASQMNMVGYDDARRTLLVRAYPEWSRTLNPVMAWETLSMTPRDDRNRNLLPHVLPDEWPRLVAPVLGVVLYGASAGLLWWAALRRFEREGRED